MAISNTGVGRPERLIWTGIPVIEEEPGHTEKDLEPFILTNVGREVHQYYIEKVMTPSGRIMGIGVIIQRIEINPDNDDYRPIDLDTYLDIKTGLEDVFVASGGIPPNTHVGIYDSIPY